MKNYLLDEIDEFSNAVHKFTTPNGNSDIMDIQSIIVVDEVALSGLLILRLLLGAMPTGTSGKSYVSVNDAMPALNKGAHLLIYHVHHHTETKVGEFLKKIEDRSHLRILILSDEVAQELSTFSAEALNDGVQGIVFTRETNLKLIAAAACFVLNGGVILPPFLIPQIAITGQDQKNGEKVPASRAQTSFKLTQRQVEVLEKICVGKTNRVIAQELAMSPSTVKSHTYVILKSLGAKNRTQAALLAKELDLITAFSSNFR